MVQPLVSVWSFWHVSSSLTVGQCHLLLSDLCSAADVNIAIGVSIFSERESDFGDLTILWVYLAFVIFAVVLNSILLLVFSGEAIMKGDKGQLCLCLTNVT